MHIVVSFYGHLQVHDYSDAIAMIIMNKEIREQLLEYGHRLFICLDSNKCRTCWPNDHSSRTKTTDTPPL